MSHSKWQIIDTGVNSAEENMRYDAQLLEKAEEFCGPVLHLYDWEKASATYGYFTDPGKLLNLEMAKELSLQLARRPTGGGVVFHLWDMAFSVLVPAHCSEFSSNTLDNYAFVNNAVLLSVKEFLSDSRCLSLTPEDFISLDPKCSHFCMAKPTRYDVMWEGKKIAGAAQRKTKKGFLHQGTISLMMPPFDYLVQVLSPGTLVAEAMMAHTYPLLRGEAMPEKILLAKERLKTLLATHLKLSSLTLEPYI